MANLFTLILAIVTFTTGIIWCLWLFRLLIARRRHLITQLDHSKPEKSLERSNNNIILKVNHNNDWIETCASFFPVLLLVFTFRSFIFEPFQIPSGSMMPTLLVGDFIIVKKFAYGIKNPITQKTLFELGHPKRGDIVVFKYPLNPRLDYIKRVVGLPGDLVRYDFINKHLTVQPRCSNEQNCASKVLINYSEFTTKYFEKNLNSIDISKINRNYFDIQLDTKKNRIISFIQCKESLDDVVHNILIIPGQYDPLDIYYQQYGSTLAEWIVPDGEYFMMGDNRDDSSDSRFWGFVPEKNLVGKAIAIWMSIEKQEGKWPTSVRLNRIGSIY